MPSKTLYISGTAGVMAIGNYGINPAAISNPLPYVSDLYFHSNLPYVTIKQRIYSGSITFPAQERGVISWSDGSKCGGCCFIMLEARYGTGVLDAVVRRYRDEHITEQNKRGYYKLAEVVVPLMREYKLIKFLVIATFASPAVCYAKWYYGYNRWGWIFTPLKKFWMKVFNTLGGNTEFIRENGEVV
jgi:hypothetical protein